MLHFTEDCLLILRTRMLHDCHCLRKLFHVNKLGVSHFVVNWQHWLKRIFNHYFSERKSLLLWHRISQHTNYLVNSGKPTDSVIIYCQNAVTRESPNLFLLPEYMYFVNWTALLAMMTSFVELFQHQMTLSSEHFILHSQTVNKHSVNGSYHL